MMTSPFTLMKGDYCTGLTPTGIIRRLEVHGLVERYFFIHCLVAMNAAQRS